MHLLYNQKKCMKFTKNKVLTFITFKTQLTFLLIQQIAAIEFKHNNHGYVQMIITWLYYENYFTWRAVRMADALYCPAKFLIPKVKKKYSFHPDSSFLPTPIRIKMGPQKADRPTVCLLGRLDRRKQPEIFFKLAHSFPHVDFMSIGTSVVPEYGLELERKYGSQANVNMLGHIDQFESDGLSKYLELTWILINTAV